MWWSARHSPGSGVELIASGQCANNPPMEPQRPSQLPQERCSSDNGHAFARLASNCCQPIMAAMYLARQADYGHYIQPIECWVPSLIGAWL